jgi:hypothetical protein
MSGTSNLEALKRTTELARQRCLIVTTAEPQLERVHASCAVEQPASIAFEHVLPLACGSLSLYEQDAKQLSRSF